MEQHMTNDKPLTEYQQGVRAVCAVCGWDTKMMGGRAAKLYSVVVAAGGTWMDVEKYYGQADPGNGWWWYSSDWRGKRGERPADHSIRETWGRWALPIAVAAPSKYAGMLNFIEVSNGD